jgi:hypothetical protein
LGVSGTNKIDLGKINCEYMNWILLLQFWVPYFCEHGDKAFGLPIKLKCLDVFFNYILYCGKAALNHVTNVCSAEEQMPKF